MKTKIIFSLAITCFIAFACYKTQNKNISHSTVSHITSTSLKTINKSANGFSKDVGKIINGDTLRSWVKNYSVQRQSPLQPCVIDAKYIGRMLNLKGCVGICFYHALKPGWTIVPRAVNANGQIIKLDSLIFPSYPNYNQTEKWIEAYKQTGASIYAHFFGSNIMWHLINNEKSTRIRLELGLNSKGEQLLMSNADVTNPNDGADVSMPCPPFCPSK